MDVSWSRGSGSRTSGADQGLQGRYGSGGLAVPGSARLGFGDVAEVDEAEAPSRPGHDQRAVKARATLPRTRAGEPRASMRACSYHASPGPGQGNVLWIGLWMIYVNTLVNLSTAVDEGCCGKVDNRCETGSCQVAGLPRSTGRYEVSTGAPAGRLIPCCGRAQSSHGGTRGHEKVPMSVEVSYHWVTASRPVGLGWSRRCAWPGRCLGVLPVRPPATGNHCLKGLPVHRGVLFAGCPGQGGRHIASREFPGDTFHALAPE
jgi:hypothetical protein